MEESTTREKILKKVRSALIERSKNPFPLADNDSGIFKSIEVEREIEFAKQLTTNGGNFLYCENHLGFVEQFISLCELKKWTNFVCIEKELTTFLDIVEFPYSGLLDETEKLNEPQVQNVLISSCECLIAQTGSIVLSSKQNILSSDFAAHIIVADFNFLVNNLKEAIHLIKVKNNNNYPSSVNIFNKVNSRKKEIFLFLIENESLLHLKKE